MIIRILRECVSRFWRLRTYASSTRKRSNDAFVRWFQEYETQNRLMTDRRG
jgi:hypothetical protein